MTDEFSWEINPQDIDKLNSEAKGGGGGAFCHKTNGTNDRQCAVCSALSPYGDRKRYPLESDGQKLYSKKKCTITWFMNTLDLENRETPIILELGKQIGNDIYQKLKNDPDWRNIAHPKAGRGAIMKVSKYKGKGGYNAYSIEIGSIADWDVSPNVLNNLWDLDRENLISMIQKGQFTETNYKNISKLELDKIYKFRILPGWNLQKTGDTRFMNFVGRHWGGVSQAEIDGAVKINLSIADDESEAKAILNDDLPFIPDPPKQTEKADANVNKFPCFGKEKAFDENEKDCQICEVFEKCKKAVYKKQLGV
jgi:hypothetical protein